MKRFLLPACFLSVLLLSHTSLTAQTNSAAISLINTGIAKYENGDLDGALADLNQAITLDPRDGHAYLNRGSVRAEQNDLDGAASDYEQAIRLFTQFITANPNDADAYASRGLAKYNQGDLNGAIEDLDHAIALDPKNAEAYLNRALAKYHKGQFEAALNDFNQSIALDPKNAQAYYYRAMVKYSQGFTEAALADYNFGVSLDPRLAKSNFIKQQEKGTEEAEITRLSPGTRPTLDPKLAQAYYTLGVRKKRQGDLDGALAAFNQVIALDPGLAKAYFCRGNTKKNKGDYAAAIADYNQSLSLDPNAQRTYIGRGDARYSQCDWKGALDDYQRAIQLAGSQRTDLLHYFVYSTQRQLKQDRLASKELETYLSQHIPSGTPYPQTGSYLLDQTSEADFLAPTTADDSAKRSTMVCTTWYFVGVKRLLTGNKAGAIEAFQKSVATKQVDIRATNLRVYNLAQGQLWSLQASR